MAVFIKYLYILPVVLVQVFPEISRACLEQSSTDNVVVPIYCLELNTMQPYASPL